MWQRKQTIYLVLAALLCLGTWFLPISTHERKGVVFSFLTTGIHGPDGGELVDVGLKIPFAILLSVLGGFLFLTVFLFKDRTRQMRLVRGSYVMLLGVITFLFITDNSLRSYLEQGGAVTSQYGPSFIMPILAMILAFMAERAIRSDEALVRSADRLR